ncbi:phage protein Gp13 family protein [Pseudomonas huanghezhanensis]|uniref:phage protein Gp13 family protein n=1 Tax=Pseudomonas huanghezhanensis TaxID=3002903 RepID=UPI002285F034|nr:phage protein Gp13 family protein [Pseudomonas sp. BSw22131]
MHITKANIYDLTFAANNLSVGDRSDFEALVSDRDPLDVFPRALDETTHCIKVGKCVLAVGGHANGGIWFVTTTLITTLAKAERFKFYRILKTHLTNIQKNPSSDTPLTNIVALANAAHIRLLETLGASFNEEILMSPAGFPFKRFWL